MLRQNYKTYDLLNTKQIIFKEYKLNLKKQTIKEGKKLCNLHFFE